MSFDEEEDCDEKREKKFHWSLLREIARNLVAYRVVEYLWNEQDGATQPEICEATDFGGSAIQKAVKRLHASGVVTIRTVPTFNERRFWIRLSPNFTEENWQYLTKWFKRYEEHLLEAYNNIAEAQRRRKQERALREKEKKAQGVEVEIL